MCRGGVPAYVIAKDAGRFPPNGAVAYGNSPNVLCIVPFCGGIIGGLWAVVLIIIGGKLGHGTEWWKAVLAYFLPAIVCCCLVTWLMMTFGFLGAIAN